MTDGPGWDHDRKIDGRFSRRTSKKTSNRATVLVAGPPGMTEAMEKALGEAVRRGERIAERLHRLLSRGGEKTPVGGTLRPAQIQAGALWEHSAGGGVRRPSCCPRRTAGPAQPLSTGDATPPARRRRSRNSCRPSAWAVHVDPELVGLITRPPEAYDRHFPREFRRCARLETETTPAGWFFRAGGSVDRILVSVGAPCSRWSSSRTGAGGGDRGLSVASRRSAPSGRRSPAHDRQCEHGSGQGDQRSFEVAVLPQDASALSYCRHRRGAWLRLACLTDAR